MRTFPALALASFAIACGSGAGPVAPADAAATPDAGASDGAGAADTGAPTDDAAADAQPAADATPSEGNCAACTASDCLAQLQACGASQSCVNDLVSFNDCLSAASGDCGTAFAAGGAEQASLWACLSTKCADVCGTN